MRPTRCTLFVLVFFIIVLFQPSYFKLCCKKGSRSRYNKCPNLHFNDCARKTCTEEKYVVCYFSNWAWYRSDPVKFMPENINASYCTHIFYAFASLNTTTLLIEPSDPWADIVNRFFERVVAYKKKGLKVLLSIGGWNNSGGTHWSKLVNDATARAKFIEATICMLKKYKFDGLDIAYEYPGCPQGNYSAALPTDKANFNVLISETKTAFQKEALLLTAAVAAEKSYIDSCYNMAQLCRLVDWVNVMTWYDYYSYSGGLTPLAPICGTNNTWGVYETIRYYRKVLRCPAKKLVLGIPFYGRSYTLVNSSKPDFGVSITGAGEAGIYTQSAGYLAYHEICYYINNKGWKFGTNKINDSCAWNDTQFVSYDSPTDIIRKSCLINKYFKLKGAMIWTLNYDDFNNICGHGSYHLLKTLNHQLRCRPNSSSSDHC